MYGFKVTNAIKMTNTTLNLNLGIDFGTSFTKVCVRDTDRDRSWIVSFVKDRPILKESLIPTKLAVCSSGRLLGGMTQSEWLGQTEAIQVSIDFIKMRLAKIELDKEGQGYPSDSLQSFQGSDLNTPESLENLCIFYLSSVILRAKDWVLQNNADLVKNQEISWSANIGVPVKYCDSYALERFSKVLRLAWLLTESHPQSFQELKERTTQLRRDISYENMPCFAIPEIAAAVYSYTVSRQAEPGVYIFFDIGSGTLEGASFRFWRENQMPKVDFYSGEVNPLGINALAKWVASKIPDSEAQVEDDIVQRSQSLLKDIENLSRCTANHPTQGEHIANKLRVTNEAVERALQENRSFQEQKLLHLILGQGAIQGQVAKVVVNCKEKAPEYFKQSSGLRVFLGGGGKEAEYYRDTIESTHSALNHQHAGISAYNLRELPFPDNFDMSGIDRRHFHRFAIAYGLSIPKDEGPSLSLPSLFPVKPQQPHIPYAPESGRYPDDHSSM